MSIKEVPPAKPYFPEEDIRQVQRDVEKILKSGMLTLGDYTKRFEAEFQELCGVPFAVAVNSGTSAIEISLRALGLKNGDEVQVPTNTFSATAASVIFAGGKPVFTEIDDKSLCIDVENVQKNLNQNTKAVIAVHIGGLICPDIKAIREICQDKRLLLIEDAAHAQGSTYEKKSAGSLGDAGCFSFYPTKVITTGEGGIITTNRTDVAEKCRVLRDQGKENFNSNIIVELGYNWRLDEISAAIGLTQLRRLSEFVRQRNEIARFYDKQLSMMSGIRPLQVPGNMTNNYYKYIAFLSSGISREDFKHKLRERGVKCGGEVYWPPLHMQPVYQRLLNVREGDFPIAEKACKRMVCLPMYSQMTLNEAEYVIQNIREVLSTLER